MIELIDASQEGELYYCKVGIPQAGGRRCIRFGISRDSHAALRKILEARPFDTMPGLKYRFFWAQSMGGKSKTSIFIGVRCEAGKDGKKLDFEVPQDLAGNLKWLSELKSFDEVKHLEVEA